MVNEKGHLYQISNLNSNPMDIRRMATSKELMAKSESLAMAFMTLSDEESIILAWADSAKLMGNVKKIPMRFDVSKILQPFFESRLIDYEGECRNSPDTQYSALQHSPGTDTCKIGG